MVKNKFDKNTLWKNTVDFHGHACPGLAMGFRAAELALDALGCDRSIDEELVAVVENNACGVDALQMLTGCTFGKGNLYFSDLGKTVYTIARRKDSKAVRVAVRYGSTFDPDFKTTKERASSASATQQDKVHYQEALKKRINSILSAGPELFDIKEIVLEIPRTASVYQTLQCTECGEGVMEPRARIKDGKVVCIPCNEIFTNEYF